MKTNTIMTALFAATLTSSYGFDTNAYIITDHTVQNTIAVSSGTSYRISDIILENNYGNSGRGIEANGVESVIIDNTIGLRNDINMMGLNAIGINLQETTGQYSGISQTNINLIRGGENAVGIRAVNTQRVGLDRVTINLREGGTGIIADGGKTVVANSTESGTVAIRSTSINAIALRATNGASIDLRNADIHIESTAPLSGVLSAGSDSSITLTNSSMSSTHGNKMIYADGSATVTFDNVNFNNAKNQGIFNHSSFLSVTFTNGSNFSGDVNNYGHSVYINVLNGASWDVTGSCTLGRGTVTLDDSSILKFNSGSYDGSFTNINVASVMLAQGSILQIDRDASAFSAGDSITLFTGLGDYFRNDGAIIVSADGLGMIYTDNADGTFTFTGQTFAIIPEPATATLGLIGLVALVARRRKS